MVGFHDLIWSDDLADQLFGIQRIVQNQTLHGFKIAQDAAAGPFGCGKRIELVEGAVYS